MPPNSVRKHSGKLTGETQKPATGVSPPRPPHPLPEDTGTTPVKVTATAPTKLATKHNTNGKRATQPMSPSSADSGAHTATSGTITKPTTGVSLPPPPHPVAADAVITPVKATATAPINLPAKLAKGKSVASRDEPPSTQPMSPSGVDSGARTATTRSTSSGMRSRKALKKKGSDVSAEGLSLPSEPSHTEPEAPHLTTIPPVSQKKLQPQHKPAPQASPCEDLRATHGSPPSVDTNKVHEPHDVTKSKPPSCPSVPSGPVAERESTASSAHRTYQPYQECIDFILGRCQNGNDCRRPHILHASNECVHFKLENCFRGSRCPRLHVPLVEECLDFRRGTCQRGNRCRRLHVPLLSVPSLQNGKLTPEDPACNPDASISSESSAESTPPSTPPTHARTIHTISQFRTSSVADDMKFDVKKSPPASVAPPRLMAANNNPTRDVCRNFLNGKCRLGAQCHRVHPPLSNTPLRSDEVCREHSAGRCELGKNCLYRHPPQTFPSNVKSAGTQRPTSVLAAAVGEVQEAQPTTSTDIKNTKTNVLRQTQPSVVLSNCVKQPDAHTPTLEATTTSQRSKSTDKLSENVPVKTATSSSAPTTTTPVVQSKMSVNTTRSDRPQVSALPLSRGDVPVAHTLTLGATTTSQRAKGADKSSENVPAATTAAPVVQLKNSVNTTPSDRPHVFALPSARGDAPSSPSPLALSMHPQDKRVDTKVCRDFSHGRCSRPRCKYRHEMPADPRRPAEAGVDRLLGLLERSANEPRVKTQIPSMQVKDDATVLINSRTSQQPAPRPAVPEVPPGLGLEQTASSGSSQASPPAGPTTMVLNVLDSVAVTFGPGFAVKEVVTGFESRTVILKNIPTRVTAAMISQALSPFGEVTNVHIPEKRFADSNMLVKATFVDHTHAAAASTALDGARLFNTRIGVRLASHQSTSLGKGTVRDGDVFLEFPAPCRDAFVGYSSLDAAMSAVRFAHGAEMGQSILSASIYQGVPVIGAYNVKFCALPPDVVAAELDVFGPNEGVMLGRCNYPSLDDSLKELQARLEIYGELISVKVLAPPFANQTVRAWAHFSTPSAADEACRGLNGRRPCFLGLGRIVAKHSMSITYSLPKRVFDSLAANIRHLRSCVHTAIHCCDIVIRAGPKDQTGSVGVKLTAETLSTLTKLKTSFEGILRGETVRFDRRAAWDSFFARASGAAFIAALEATYPEVMIKVDLRRSLIRLFGPHSRTWRVRQAIQEQMEKLSAQKTHSLPLDGNLVGLVVNPDLLKLQQELGTGNVYIDSRTLTLKVRGNKDAVQVASLIIQQARRRRHQLAGKQIANGCPICLDKVSLPITLDCGHTWCKRCLTSYLLAAIDTKVFPLNCLGDGAQCSNQIPISIVRRILTSEDFQRLAHASFLAYIHSRPSEFHYCPTPDCVQVYRSAPRDTVLQCPSCLIRICPNCHVEYHEGTKCPDSETEELRLFEEWTSTRDVKRCPGCKTYIERDAGCNHMECTRCRTHICWVCLETFPQGNAVYDHMRAVHGGIGL